MKISLAICCWASHLLCYWLTTTDLIFKICLKFQAYQGLTSHVSEVHQLLDEHGATNVLWENTSTPIYVFCNYMYWSRVCSQEFWCMLSDLKIQLELPQNENTWLARYDSVGNLKNIQWSSILHCCCSADEGIFCVLRASYDWLCKASLSIFPLLQYRQFTVPCSGMLLEYSQVEVHIMNEAPAFTWKAEYYKSLMCYLEVVMRK